MTINKIKLNDVIFDIVPTSDAAITCINNAFADIGCTTDEMTEALKKLSDLMASMECANARIDLIEYELERLRPATDAKAENPKQKDDLEISNRIIPSEDFLKLEGNMFLD